MIFQNSTLLIHVQILSFISSAMRSWDTGDNDVSHVHADHGECRSTTRQTMWSPVAYILHENRTSLLLTSSCPRRVIHFRRYIRMTTTGRRLQIPLPGEHADHCLSNHHCHSNHIHHASKSSKSKGREDQVNPIVDTSVLLFFLLLVRRRLQVVVADLDVGTTYVYPRILSVRCPKPPKHDVITHVHLLP